LAGVQGAAKILADCRHTCPVTFASGSGGPGGAVGGGGNGGELILTYDNPIEYLSVAPGAGGGAGLGGDYGIGERSR